jgi:hypothetical protein
LKKGLFIIIGLVILFVLAVAVIEYNNKSAFSTSPEEVLYHSDEVKVGIKRIYKTIYVDSGDVSYVFFLGDKDVPTLYISEFKRKSYGWKNTNTNQIPIKQGLNGEIIVGGVEDGEYYGIVSSEVNQVTLGSRKAELISLDAEKVWFFYKPTKEEVQSGPNFYNLEGKEL